MTEQPVRPAPRRPPDAPTVDIVMSVYNRARYVGEQIRSIQEQTHVRWRLWIRDDGSEDGSRDVVRRIAADDPRIHVHFEDPRNLGSGPSFGQLIERLPDDARYVFCSDADDVWLPTKVERTLELLLTTEARAPGPALVHTDLTVVDEALRTISPSLWRRGGIDPADATLERVMVSNVATGPTLALNRALADLVVPIPGACPYQDWWIAMVAAAFGTIVGLPESTVLYRRHGTNYAGLARGGGVAATLKVLPRAAPASDVRRWIDRTASQASAFLERYGDRLPQEKRDAMRRVAEIPSLSPLARKGRILSAFRLRERGWLHVLGLAIRG